jgi:adenosylcobyric acid synthase
MAESSDIKGATPLMVQGTCSGAGKSLLVAGLCRILSDMGVRVAPFKSQNMALNSFVTEGGSEIGRAQALQAEAARIKPVADINPILLKASGDAGCQVIVNGKVHSNMTARQYYGFKDEAWEAVASAYDRLSAGYEVVVIEGAGSPAEINLMEDEIVNMRVARYAQSPVLLVGDIDRGGVFASFYGTMGLLDGDARHIKGFVVNKFRGDIEILNPALEMIREKTGVPVVGVIPYVRGLGLDEEDAVPFARHRPEGRAATLKIVVVGIPYISNFTDFDPFCLEPDVELLYSASPADIENADILILPGSKNTVKDLLYLRGAGLEESIKRAAEKGIHVIGICGGYQMLGIRISDPLHVEGRTDEVEGIGLLDVETEIRGAKVTSQTEGEADMFGFKGRLRGYEIHMGETTGDIGLLMLHRLSGGATMRDGSRRGNVWGTYLHGIFDNDGFRLCLLNTLRKKKGLPLSESMVNYAEVKDANIDRWTAIVKKHLDMDFVKRLLNGV